MLAETSNALATHAVTATTQPAAGLRWTDIVALVGAAAWLPQLWRLLQRPRVTPIVGGQIEVGFTILGPLFNPKIAFRTERRPALVTGIDYSVRHERGQVTDFRCVQLIEHGSQSESSSGETAVHQRAQDVVAIVLVPTMIVERKTVSREISCWQNLERLNIALGRAVDRLRGPGAAWIRDVERSAEYVEIRQFLVDAFVWQPGEYTVRCTVTVAGQRSRPTCEFRFVLGETAVAALRENTATLEHNFRESLIPGAPGEKKAPMLFKWVYPYAVASEEEVPSTQ